MDRMVWIWIYRGGEKKKKRLLGELEETEKREQRQKRIEGRKNGKDRKKR